MNNVGGTLHIPYVSTAHQGTFQCIARNEAGYDQSATLIHVAGKRMGGKCFSDNHSCTMQVFHNVLLHTNFITIMS